jgi:hypothetical protein
VSGNFGEAHSGLIRLVVQLVRERRLSRVTKRCLDAKSKRDREYAIRVLEILQQVGEQDLGIEVKPKPVPQPRKSEEEPSPGGQHALPAAPMESNLDDPETSTAA